MPEEALVATLPQVEIYQFYVWLRQISPAIWRRLLMRSDCTIYDLHYILQLAFGWDDSHLHQFKLYGKTYGTYKEGGVSFTDNSKEVTLAALGLRVNERFLYQYDFGAGWEHEIRLEKKLSLVPQKVYPVCIGGARKVPPESCRGAWHYQEMGQYFSLYYIDTRLTELLSELMEKLENNDREAAAAVYKDNAEEVEILKRWLAQKQAKIKRREINLRLKQYAGGDEEWRRELF